ncbi:MAG: hypothetical protein KAS04_02940 [Candidatus Aenigmarchaeota archaeon]|nr:hypothetical protein [Candidatus Aenigmarchaeota archaeon]
MESCCPLGAELDKKMNVLYETDNFFLVPALGQMGIEGYSLVCSKGHYIGMGNVPENYEPELEDVLGRSKNTIAREYDSKVVAFEHGPKLGCHSGGGCLQHAHIHIVPTPVDIMKFLKGKFDPGKIQEIQGFDKLREISSKGEQSYMFVNTHEGQMHLIEADVPLPSQYLRQVIAEGMEIKKWNWKEYMDTETFERTLNKLRNKF